MGDVTLELKDINKYYPNPKAKNANHALQDISFTLTEGIYGLVGANGAGKSTLIQILTGNLQADSGEIYVNGQRISTKDKSYKSLIGYMPQQQWIYENMTCEQFINYMAGLKGINKRDRRKQTESLLGEVHLLEKRYDKISTLSGGMKQRLLLAQAMLGQPSLLILDEPTAGVDPEERENISGLVKKCSEGRIVLFSTHILTDLEKISKETIWLGKGRIIS